MQAKNALRSLCRKTFAIVALVGIAYVIAAASGAEKFHLRFSPPDGIVCISTIKSSRTKDLGANGKRTDSSVAVERQMFQKTATGYSILFKAESIKAMRDGKPLIKSEAALVKSLASVDVTYVIDLAGRCTAIRGFEDATEELTQQLKDSVPPQVIDSLPTIIKGVLTKSIAEWNGRVAIFVGRTAKIGDVWNTTGSADLPFGGEIPMPVKVKFAGMVNQGGKQLVKITYKSSAGGKSLVQSVQGMFDKMAGSAGAQFKILSVRMNTQGERLIDPSTMLIYSEAYTRDSTMTVESPDGPVNGKMKESRQYTNKYFLK